MPSAESLTPARSAGMQLYQHDSAFTFRFVLRGALEQPWTAELEQAWITAASILQGKELVVDVTGLTGMDQDGLKLLSTMRNRGARLITGSTRDATITGANRLPLAKAALLVVAAVSLTVAISLSCTAYSTALGTRGGPENTGEAVPNLRHSLAKDTRGGSSERMTSPACGAECVVERARASICLIQGSYVFRNRETGNVLRRADWVLDGDDSVLESSFSGTGFLISPDGRILTNRHIAQPWWKDADAQQIVAAGHRPAVKRLVAYFPGRTTPYSLTHIRTSTQVDLAVVRTGERRSLPVPLRIDGQEAVKPGRQVLMLGYPAGISAVLGRSGTAKLEGIPGFLTFTDQQVSQALAMRSLIEPFVSVGYLSNVSRDVLTISAMTSDGSSGSPVLNEHGRVIAIHFASLTHVAGGSLAVPARLALELVGSE